ncbi:MAG: glycosyltransferase family 39 protein [Saprospiraceae bacterium]|nr:glycosyltransferase family 39 protein [Saprospiraceae bacterium]
MMRDLNDKKLFLFFLCIWLILNVLQAAFTQLDPDEAYYWMYSKELDWGYFDHPPAIAILIKLGYALIKNELGVRLGIILLQIGSFYGIWLILGKPQEKSKIWTLITLLVAMPMLQVYGFIATPDSPLLFFAAWFFYFYQKFVTKETWFNTLFLGACMAALLYSKYHGILLIFFTLLSNWRLLLKPQFYIASIFGAMLFFPHLYWQYSQDFPSFRYHLVGRDDPYELKHTANYILNQFLIFNPLLFPFILISLFRQVNKDALYRAFLFIIFGFWFFFLYTTSKGHVEPQWTVLLSIPFVILTWKYAVRDNNFIFAQWLKRLALLSFGLLLIARIALIKGNIFNWKSNFHRSVWVSELQEKAKGLPIIFQNSYRDPSLYTFYTGELAYSFTDANYRKNQFDIWDWEKALHNQRVAMAGQPLWNCRYCQNLKLTRKIFKLKFIDSLQITQKINFDFKIPSEHTINKSVSLSIEIENPYYHTIQMNAGNMPLQIVAIFYDFEKEKIKNITKVNFKTPVNQLLPQKTLAAKVNFSIPNMPAGEYVFALGIQTGDLPPSFNSKLIKIKVTQ